MQSRLPRELRSMVYTYLLEDDTIFDSRDPTPNSVLKGHSHIPLSSFMGYETLTELSEEWYQRTIFRVRNDADLSDYFKSARLVWPFPDVDPAHHIRNVQVDVQPQFMDSFRDTWEPGDGTPGSFYELRRLLKPATLRLNLAYEDWNVGGYKTNDEIQDFRGLDEEFVDVLECLIEKGVKVGVMVYEKRFGVTGFDEEEGGSGWVGLEHLNEKAWSRFLGRVRRREEIPIS